MALKISRGVWFISILATLAALLYVYAGLPENMVVLMEGNDLIYGSREAFFYITLAAMTIVNAFVFLIGSLYRHDETLRTWFNVQVVILNIFFIVAIFLISAINSNERFDFDRIGFIVYGSVALIAFWTMVWPVIAILRKFSRKQAV